MGGKGSWFLVTNLFTTFVVAFSAPGVHSNTVYAGKGSLGNEVAKKTKIQQHQQSLVSEMPACKFIRGSEMPASQIVGLRRCANSLVAVRCQLRRSFTHGSKMPASQIEVAPLRGLIGVAPLRESLIQLAKLNGTPVRCG